MTDDYSIVNKGVCSYPQLENFVSVKQFLIIDGGKSGKTPDGRYLLVKLTNNRTENVTAALLKVEQFNERGDLIAVDDVRVDGFCGYPKKSFAVENKIHVAPTCCDCRITVVEAEFGNYAYSAEDMGAEPEYRVRDNSAAKAAPSPALKKVGKAGVRVEPRSLKMPLLVFLVSLAVLIAAFIGIFVYIETTTAPMTDFLHDGVYYAFEGKDSSEESDIYVTGYKGSRSKIEIPAKIEKHRVVRVAPEAFKGNSDLVSVRFAGSISINGSAFMDCANLKTVNLQNATYIGTGAFRHCSKLSKVTIEKATEIGDYAFNDCPQLTSVVIDDSRPSIKIGHGAFGNCTRLRTVDISREIEYDMSSVAVFSGSVAVKDLHLSTFTCGADGDYTVSALFDGAPSLSTLVIDSIDRVGAALCEGLSVETVRFNDVAVPEIGAHAFYGCEDLKEVFMPEPATYVGRGAFYNTSISKFDGRYLETIGDGAFSGCKNLSVITLAGNTVLNEIGEEAFKGSAIGSVSIPSTAAVGDGAFGDCASLTSVIFAEDCALTEIPKNAFSGCVKLSSINIPSTVNSIGNHAFDGCAALAECALPPDLGVIGADAFADSGLVSLTIPSTVMTVNFGAFSGCDNLASLTLPFVGRTRASYNFLPYIFGAETYMGYGAVPSSLTRVTVTEGSVAADNMYYGCEHIAEIVYTDGLAYVGNQAFRGCSSLSGIALRDDTESVGDYAFYGCGSLTEIVLPDAVTALGQAAFAGCSSVNTLITPFVGESRYGGGGLRYMFIDPSDGAASAIPASLKKVEITDSATIHANSFYGSTVREVEFGEATTSIESGAFYDNKKLNIVTLPKALDSIAPDAFYGCNLLYEVFNFSDLDVVAGEPDNGYVAYYALKVHTTDEPRLPFALYEGYGFVENEEKWHLVQYDESLTELNLPAAVETDEYSFTRYEIRNNVFMNNALVESVSVPSNVTDIGNYAFFGCDKLKTATVEDGVASMGVSVFEGCGSLTDFVFPKTVGTVSERVFFGCSALERVVLPDSIDAVGNSAFCGCVSLKSAVIPDDCTSVGDMAFSGCTMLCDVNVPNSCVYIGASAYNGCNRIKTVTLPASLEHIGDSAFGGCTKLYEVYDLCSFDISRGSTGNGYVAYYAYAVHVSADEALDSTVIDDLHYYKLDGDWYLVDYYGESGELNVSSFTYNGETVDNIRVKDSAFQNYGFIKSLTADTSIAYIGEHAFENCQGLQTVNLSADNLTIGYNSFAFCGALGSLEVNTAAGGDATVESNAFTGSGLVSVVFNGGNVVIREMAFTVCNYLESFNADCAKIDIYGNAFYTPDVFDAAINARIKCATANLWYSAFGQSRLQSLVLNASESVQISEYVFSGNYLQNVDITGGTVDIAQYSFNNCTQMQKINIVGSQVTTARRAFGSTVADSLKIGADGASTMSFTDNVFYRVTVGTLELSGDIALSASAISYSVIGTLEIDDVKDTLNISSILYSSTVTAKLAIRGAYVAIEESAFGFRYDGNSSISALDISATDSLTVNTNAFYNQTELKSIVLTSDKTSSIGEYAFYNCYNLTSLTLPASLTAIRNSTFYGCNMLAEIAIPNGVTSIGDSAFYNCYNAAKLSIGNGVTSIGINAFYNCYNVSELTIPNSVTSIGNNAFSNCNRLTKLQLSSGLTEIVGNAFYGCSALTALTVPNNVTSIGNNAFASCGSLSSLILPNGLTQIESYAFSGCAWLKELEIPDSVRSIGNNAFGECVNLVTLKLPNGLTEIESYVFGNCGALKELTIPDSVKSIGSNAFCYCYSLTELTIPNSVTAMGEGAFCGCSGLTSLSLPDSLSIIPTRAFEGCSELGELSVPRGVTEIGMSAFSECRSLTELKLPDGLSKIGDGAFNGCGALTALTLPKSLSALGSNAFSGCVSLRTLVLPDNLTGISSYAFYGCNELTELKLPSKAATVGGNAFYGCHSLKKLSLPSGLTSVANGAFYGCNSLAELALPTGLNTIGERAFAGISAITELKLPDGLQNIGSRAFSDATSLKYAELPATLSYIGSGAFSGATQLFAVYNKSMYLSITVGGSDNGGVAQYAVIVTDDPKKAVVTYTESGDCKFVLADGVWYLYSINGTELPASVTTPQGVINKYAIKSYTFGSYIMSIVVPSSVTKIMPNAFSYADRVYYEGTSEQWSAITQDGSSGIYSIYFYVDCVHRGGEWTRIDGEISTKKTELGEWTTVKEATCTEQGARRRDCVNEDCDYYEEEIIPPKGHTAGADGKCTVCGEAIPDETGGDEPTGGGTGGEAAASPTAYTVKTKYDGIWGLV